MRHGTKSRPKNFGSYERNLKFILVMGSRELNSLRPNLLLFLNSSMVELSVVNQLVVGLIPTWRDLITRFLKLTFLRLKRRAEKGENLSVPGSHVAGFSEPQESRVKK